MTEYQIVNFEECAMSVDSVVSQIRLIQEVQKKVMKSGEHYGTIPGCGDKPTLLKAGAEKLGFTFRLAPEFEITTIDWPGGHREYQVKCRLRHIPTGTMVGEGIGTCATMEGKYRYRADNTGNPVPPEYWKSRDKDLLGGPFNTTRKIDGQWYIFQRVEHDNPADYWNTAEKMAKKRAHVDAILTATAASDIFTQDIEDMPEVIPGAAGKKPDKPEFKPPQQKTAPPQGGAGATEPQIKAINSLLTALGVSDELQRHEVITDALGLPETITSISKISKAQASEVIKKLGELTDAKAKETVNG